MTTNSGVDRFSLSRSLLIGLAGIAVASATLAGIGGWTSSGPAGASVYNFAVDPSTPSRVFALGPDGVRRSSEGEQMDEGRVPNGLFSMVIAPLRLFASIRD